jgi:hypothetical protein
MESFDFRAFMALFESRLRKNTAAEVKDFNILP